MWEIREAGEAPAAAAESHDARTPAAADAGFRMRQAILGGAHWFDALLDEVERWRLPGEHVDGREFRYLIAGEAFDWLLLAERLVGEAADVIPQSEADALLWEGRWPLDLDDDTFARRIGPGKHSAHLNYLYGVLVEEALQLHVIEEFQKEVRAQAWGLTPRDDEAMFPRVYGYPYLELRGRYYEDTRILLGDEVSLADWRAFTYWLFKFRLRWQDKARVASDTRKGLAQLTRMELAASARRHGARLNDAEFADRFA